MKETVILRARIKKGPKGEKDVSDYRKDPEKVKKMLRKACRLDAQ